MTRREFFPKAAAAALGAGALLERSAALAAPLSTSSTAGYRMLGRTGISVSEISFGSHLDPPSEADPQGRAAQIRKGLELGINLFDIYDLHYGQYQAMSEILGPVRQDVLISLYIEGTDATAEVDTALRTFNTDYIDLYRLAEPSAADMANKYPVLQRAKEQGKIRAVGLASHDHSNVVRLLREYPELDYLMLPYNFQHQRISPMTLVDPATWAEIKAGRASLRMRADALRKPVEAAQDCLYGACSDSELLPLLRETGVGLVAIKPFAGGAAHNLDPSHPVLQELQGDGTSFAQAALKFVLQASEFACAIPAMNSVDEVVENCQVMGSGGLSEADAMLLQSYADAADESKGAYLPGKYRWLEEDWKA